MAEYIDREKAIETARLNYCKDCNSINGIRCRGCGFDDAMLELESVPSADVVEVVHCKWVEKGYEGIMTYCSECLHRAPFNNHQELILSNYCPNCGAKMDGDTNAE